MFLRKKNQFYIISLRGMEHFPYKINITFPFFSFWKPCTFISLRDKRIGCQSWFYFLVMWSCGYNYNCKDILLIRRKMIMVFKPLRHSISDYQTFKCLIVTYHNLWFAFFIYSLQLFFNCLNFLFSYKYFRWPYVYSFY